VSERAFDALIYTNRDPPAVGDVVAMGGRDYVVVSDRPWITWKHQVWLKEVKQPLSSPPPRHP